MHLAALNGHRDTMELLHSRSLPLLSPNNAGSTPLHYAGPQIITFCIFLSMLIGMVVLAMMGRVEVMKYLIDNGGDINHVNNTGSTPLHAGSLNGYGECMELLIDKVSALFHRLSIAFPFTLSVFVILFLLPSFYFFPSPPSLTHLVGVLSSSAPSPLLSSSSIVALTSPLCPIGSGYQLQEQIRLHSSQLCRLQLAWSFANL